MPEKPATTETVEQRLSDVLVPESVEPANPGLALYRESFREAEITTQINAALMSSLRASEDGSAIFQRRVDLAEMSYRATLKATRPQDWIAFKDKEENEVCMLRASGADHVHLYFGIKMQVAPFDGRGFFDPVRRTLRNGHYSLTCYGAAISEVTGRHIPYLEATRRSDEEFTGRAEDQNGDLTRDAKEAERANEADLRSATLTLFRTKVARIIGGCSRVPIGDLEKAWEGTPKKIANITHGHGYGSSSDRTASKLTPEEVGTEKKKLEEEVLRRVGGDSSAARQLVKDITKGPNFQGWDSVAKLTKDWQVTQAWKALRAHPVFGDQQKGAGPAPAAGGREPGQEG